MTDARPAAVVVLAGPPSAALEPVLGAQGVARLHDVLVRRALAWAESVGTAYVDDDAGGDPGTRCAAAVDRVHAEHGGGPVLLVGIATPQISPTVGREALEDLRSGTDVTYGPTAHGGFYLVGLREPHPEVFALPPEAWGGGRVLDLALRAATAAGLSLAMLRSERDLAGPEDVAAFLADPLTPPEVAELLRPPA